MNQIDNIMALADSFAEYRDHSEYVHARQALRAAITQALTPGEPVGDDRVMTVVYRDPTKDDVQSFMDHPKAVWFGWCHAPYQRDDARRRLEKATAPQPQPKQEPIQTTGETNVELVFYSDDASNGQQRELVGKVEMGQLVGNRPNEGACNPNSEREIAVIRGLDEYGPLLDWYRHWINFPVGTKLYTAPHPHPDDTALLRQALEQLEINRTNFRKGPSKSMCKMLAGGNDQVIAALRERLK